MRRCVVGLIAIAAVCGAQHIQFGSAVREGILIANPAWDSAGNLIALTRNIALGIGPGGSRPVVLLNRYNRDGSSRGLTDTGLAGTGVSPAYLAVDARDRVYVGENREGEPEVLRFLADGTRERVSLFVPFTRILCIAFAPDGDPVVLGVDAGPTIQVARLDAETLRPVATRLFPLPVGNARAMAVDAEGSVYIAGAAAGSAFPTEGPGTIGCTDCMGGGAFVIKLSPDLRTVVYATVIGSRALTGATTIQVARDGTAYVAGYVIGGGGESPFPTTPGAFQERLDRAPELWISGSGFGFVTGPSTGFIVRLSADGRTLLSSTLLGGSLSESIDGLTLDEQGRVLVHGYAASRDFPATGVFTTRCGPDRGRSYQSTFITRLDPELRRVEKSVVAGGVTSRGLPSGVLRGSVFLLLGDSPALADLDHDERSDVSCIANGASYEGAAAVTPGQLLSIFGRGLTPEPAATFETGAPLPDAAAGTEVLFNGVRAPILAAGPSQINVVVPLGVEPGSWMEIKLDGRRIYLRNLRWFINSPRSLLRIGTDGSVPVLPDAPYLLLADALNEDGSRNSADNPAAPGSLITVFTTGLGALDTSLSAGSYGDGTTRPAQSYIVRTAQDRIEEVESATIPGRTVAVNAVRFRVPETARRDLRFSIEPSYSAANFTAANFIYVRQ